MKNLVLTYHEGKANHVEIFKYPDGQQNVVVDLNYYSPKDDIKIKCSVRNFNELEVLLCIIAALKKFDRKVTHIEFIYLFGMRSDRSFESGQPNYFMDVVAPIIRSIDIYHKTFFSPHTQFCAMQAGGYGRASILASFQDEVKKQILIGADQSFNDGFVFANMRKERTEDGVIQNLSPEDIAKLKGYLEKSPESELLLCDDLCDGGATFISASKVLRSHFPEKKLNLYINHALFTKGIDVVAEHFDRIYCTNSYQTLSHPKLTQLKVI